MEDKELENLKEPLTRGEFYKFLLNDVAHIWRTVSYLKGISTFHIALTMGLMGGIITLIVLVLKG